MFTIRRSQIEALANDGSRRARKEWIEALRARGLTVTDNPQTGEIAIEDAASGKAFVKSESGGVCVTSCEKGPLGEDRSWHLKYNSDKALSQIIDPGGLRIVFDYDERKRLSAIHRGSYGRSAFLYDSGDNLSGIVGPDGSLARMIHDESGRLIEAIDRNGNSRRFEYSSSGRPSRVIGFQEETATHEYNSRGELIATVSPLGRRQSYKKDPTGTATILSVQENGKTEVREVVRIKNDREKEDREFVYPDSTFARFSYQDGRLISAINNECTVRLTYNAEGHVEKETTTFTRIQRPPSAVSYSRDALGNLVGIQPPAGEHLEFDRDGEHRLSAVRSGKQVWRVSYELSGALRAIEYPNGVKFLRQCNAFGLPEIQTVSAAGISSLIPDITWNYDARDRVIAESSGGKEYKFEYDAESRLLRVESIATGTSQSWDPDANGNPRAIRGSQCAYNKTDQLERLGAEEFTYDSHGNMTAGLSPKGRIACEYNGRGQLIQTSVGGKITRYVYDAFGRRVCKYGQGSATFFTWAGQWLLSETTERDGRSTRCDYLLAPDFGVPLAKRINGWTHHIHYGRRFEPLAMTDQRGTVVWRAEWDAFGEARVDKSSTASLFLRLPCQYFDIETGLHYNLARYYDPQLGRYLQRDPLGNQSGSWNDYIYCDGDPLNRCDPAGEFLQILAGVAIGAAIGAVAGAGMEMWRQHKAGKSLGSMDWGKIGKEALIGGAVGAVGGLIISAAPLLVGALGGGLAASVAGFGLVGGVAAAVQTCMNASLHHQPVTAGDLLGSFAGGAAIGAVTAGIGGLLSGGARQALQEGETVAAEETVGKAASEEARCLNGCPVDSITGEVVDWVTDFTFPGALVLTLKRTYLSNLGHGTHFGRGWTSNWSQTVEFDRDSAIWHGGDGRWVKFRLASEQDEKWVSNPDAPKLFLRRMLTGSFEVRDSERCILRFKSSVAGRWLLTEIEDPNGYWIRFTYDRAGALRLVEHSGGYRLSVEGSPNGISRIVFLGEGEDPVELVRYRYDQRGCLTEVVNGTGTPFRYAYDDSGRQTRWQDRNGAWIEHQYDANGKCVRAFGPNGMFDYRFEYDDENRTNHVIDSLGNVKTYVYNDLQQPIEITDGRGAVRRIRWDRQSNKVEETDGAGRAFHQEFDANANLTLFRDALDRTTRIEYNALSLPEALTDAAGKVWKRRFDERGNLIEAVGPDGAAWSYERDSEGNVIAVKDPLGYTRRFGYDRRGLVVWQTDAQRNRTEFTRDSMGRVTMTRDPLGRKTQYFYNRAGKLAEVELPDRKRLRWKYDDEGNLISRTGADARTYKYVYGVFDRLAEIEKPSGGKLKLSYDTEGRLSGVENEIHQVWTYEYNATGEVVRESDFHGRVQEFEYDASGLCIRRLNGAGDEFVLHRDAAGQLLGQTGAVQSRFEYDALGRIKLAVNGGVGDGTPEILVALDYDEYGRVLRETQNGSTVESFFDKRGLRIKRVAAGMKSLWTWDENGRAKAVAFADNESIEFVRDAGGRETVRRLGGGLELRQAYDAVDRITRQWVGQVIEGAEASSTLQRTYRQNEAGEVWEVEDSSWGVSTFRYNPDGRVIRADRHLGPSEEFAYDLAGNIAETANRISGVKQSRGEAVIGAATRFYGRNGRLERIGDTRYEWDADGRLKEKRDGSQRWRYEWAPDGRLRAVQRPDGQRWAYSYDAFGRRVAKSGSGFAGRYIWDGDVVATETDTRQNSVEWLFEPGGFRPLAKREDSTVWRCMNDQVGSPRALIGNGGEIGWSALQTIWGGTAELTASTECPVRFQGQWHDAESGLHYNFHRYYDPEVGQYLSPDPNGLGGGTRSYGYVHNPLSWVDPLGLAGCGAAGGPLPKNLQKAAAGVKAPGKFDVTVASEAEARLVVQEAMPDAVELPRAVAGEPYPSPPPGVKKWFQVQPAEPEVGNTLPHVKYADWTGGKKGSGGSWGHVFFPPGGD